MRAVTTLLVDPGFAELGYAVVRHAEGADKLMQLGVVTTKPGQRALKTEDSFRRLRETGTRLLNLVEFWEIDALAFESLSIPQQTSKQAAIKIGHPYGLLAMLAVSQDLPCAMVSPQAVKKALCGDISASKDAVRDAVTRTYSGPAMKHFCEEYAEGRRNHAYDALAVYPAVAGTDMMRALKRSV